MYTLRHAGSLIFALFLGSIVVLLLASIFGPEAHAQSHLITTAPAQLVTERGMVVGGSINGTVTDMDGAELAGAHVTLQTNGAGPELTLTADSAGSFNFAAVEPGTIKLTISSAGFATHVEDGVVLHSGEIFELPPVALKAAASTEVEVVFSRQDLAEEQLQAEEKQRVFGVIPNFYVSYDKDAVPLTTSQKYRLALRMSLDPVSFASSAVSAGFEQSINEFRGYGQGVHGYAKRFGASYGDGFTSILIGGAILPSLLHQDPRYLYKGTGSIRSRTLYAIASVVICKGDNGHWQPNYSNVFGNMAAAGISNIYYPSTDRDGAQLTIGNSLLNTASGAIGALFEEFLIRKISRGVPQ